MPSSSASSRSSSLPERPTKGSPWRSSSRPGASPTNMRSASGSPTPNTTWVRPAESGHRVHAGASAASSARSVARWPPPHGTAHPRPRPAGGARSGSPAADSPVRRRGTRGADAAQHLVGDGAEEPGPLVGGDLLVALAAEEHHLVARPRPAPSGPQSTTSWSMVTMPASGRRRPPISTSTPPSNRRAGHAVGVAEGTVATTEPARRAGGAGRRRGARRPRARARR